jgi:diketogulonate reductase-like aldo/keto reductase
MEYKFFKDWTKLPIIWLGTYGFWWYLETDYLKDKEDVNIIKRAIKLWYTHIDTAEWYAGWHTEELIWKAIYWCDRDKLFITSKVSQNNLSYKGVIDSCKKSLKRLKTAYLDLYLIHWYNSNIPLKETIKALKYLKGKWKIKNFWVSNFSIENLKEAEKYTSGIMANQIEYNYFTREIWQYNDNLTEIVKYCIESSILVIACRPLAFWNFWNKEPLMMLKWLVEQKWVVTIVKSRNIKHLRENVKYFI